MYCEHLRIFLLDNLIPFCCSSRKRRRWGQRRKFANGCCGRWVVLWESVSKDIALNALSEIVIVTISGETYRELNETSLRGPRKHCAETSIKKRSEGSSFFQRKRCLDAHFVHLCHGKEILMSSIFSFGANTLIANEKINLNLFFFHFSSSIQRTTR